MTALVGLQRDLQRHVLSGDAAIVTAVNDTPAVPVATRLNVYSNAYRIRLADALAANMPRLKELLGEEQFSAVAGAYVDAHPSRFASIRWFGDRLAEVLAQAHPSQPWLAELARWEWALASSFDAKDASAVGVECLATIAPGDWGELRLQFHPSVQYLELATNAQALFKALSEEQQPPQPAILASPQPWLLWRQDLKTQYRSLDAAESAGLQVTRAGGTFGAMCEVLCEWHDADEVPLAAAGMLKRWIVEELLVRVSA
ncbi:MAG TPA: DNA-binding domain-containing protein [Steroidobacteraceae bacterium]|nr:DNA-binding domain-containing protein [Steroidobacteraceae bacterium]